MKQALVVKLAPTPEQHAALLRTLETFNAAFIAYKARMAGVRVVCIDPAYTSQTCSRCGHCEKANRKSQARFLCRSCGFSAHADANAACNIARRAAVIPPNAAPLAG
jgi:transposase